MKSVLCLLPPLVLLSLSLTAWAAPSGDDRWISPKVQSVYKDQVTQRSITITGSGFVGKVGDRYFFFCDSHLSQGARLALFESYQANAARLRPKMDSNGNASRLSNNDADLEIIEIEKPSSGFHPIFIHNPETGDFEAEPSWDPRDHVPCLSVARGFCALVPPKTDGTPKAYDYHNQNVRDDDPVRGRVGVTLALGQKELMTDSEIVSGMSGAPLLMTKSRPAIGGLSKSFDRYFPRSHFSTIMQINELLQKFLGGARGSLSPTQWRFREDIATYRDYGNGTQEINPEWKPSGDLESVSSGGGESGDSGSHREGSGSGVGKGSPEIRAGMLWQGRPTLAFRVGKKVGRSYVKSLVVYANRPGEEFARGLTQWIHGLTFEPLPEDNNESLLVDLLKERLAQVPLGPVGNSECLIDGHALQEGKIQIRLRKPQPKFSPSGSRGSSNDESIVIDIDPRLSLFHPVVQASFRDSNSHVTSKFNIDIKGLFFVDVAQAEQRRGETVENPIASEFISRFGDAPYITYQPIEGLKAVSFACYRTPDTLSASSDCQKHSQVEPILSSQATDLMSLKLPGGR